MVRCAYSACLLLLAGCIAGFPSGPPDPGVLPERITVLSVSARVIGEDAVDPHVILDFHVRNDAKKTADRVSVFVTALQGTEPVGHGASRESPRIRVGRKATVGVRLDRPTTGLADFDCFAYEVEALIDGHLGRTAPVLECLR